MDPEKAKAYGRKWRAENREKVKARNKKWYEKNLEKEKTRRKEYYFANLEREKIRHKKWRAENPTKIRDKNRKPSARYRLGIKGAKARNYQWEITFEQWEILVSSGKCHYCDSELSETGCGLDRKDNKIGYLINNVIACCTACNTIKGKHLSHEEMVLIMPLVMEHRKRVSLVSVPV